MLHKCYVLENNVRNFNFKTCIQYINHIGKQKFGPSFQLVKEDKEVILKLLIYAIRAEEDALEHQIDLSKGILLLGPIGCGKTSLMHLIKLFIFKEFDYRVVSTRKIVTEFIAEGQPILSKYGLTNQIYCFDDLGIENNIKQFGNETNAMAEILLNRYEILINEKTVTHATTNLNADELEKLYGNRLRSRLRSMFNLISFPESAPDKRK